MGSTATLASARSAQVEARASLVEALDGEAGFGMSDLRFKRDLGCLRLAMERGSISAAAFLLSDAAFRSRSAFADDGVRGFLSEAEQWLENAHAFEEANGPESMLDQNHPVNVQCRAAALVLAERRKAFRRPRDLS